MNTLKLLSVLIFSCVLIADDSVRFAWYGIIYCAENKSDTSILSQRLDISKDIPKLSNYKKLSTESSEEDTAFIERWIKQGAEEAQLRFDVYTREKRSTTLPMNGILRVMPPLDDNEKAPVWEFAVSYVSVEETKIPETQSPFSSSCLHYTYRFTIKPLRVLPKRRVPLIEQGMTQ